MTITLAPASPGFGHALRSARERQRLSQTRLAHAAGMHPSLIVRLESGNRNPSHDTVRRIARALGLSAAQTAWLEAEANYLPDGVAIADVVALVRGEDGA